MIQAVDSPTISPNDRKNHHLTLASVSMLAIGGTIGTGLFFSISTVLKNGPFPTLVAMSYLLFLVMLILEMTAELSVFMPGNGLICKFQFVFLSELLGLANNLIYWASWGFTLALELSLIVSTCQYWNADLVETYPGTLIFCTWLLLTIFNLLPVNLYGEIEFWIALVKILAIAGWIVFVILRLVSSGTLLDTYTKDLPFSFFGDFSFPTGYVIRFINSLVFASFIFQSVESIAITAGDVANPQVTIPKVTKLIFYRIVIFYLLSAFLLTLTIPYDDERLTGGNGDGKGQLLSSPFLISLINCGLSDNGIMLSTFNFVIYTALLSAANSNIYFGSRCLQAIGENYSGKSTLATLVSSCNSSEVPVVSVLVTSAFGLISILLRYNSIATIFNFLLTCCASAGLLMWCLVALSYMRFGRVLQLHGIDRSRLHYASKWNLQQWAPFVALNITLILLCNGLSCYWHFSYAALLGAYSTPALFVAFWGLFEMYDGHGLHEVEEINIFHDTFQWRKEVDEEA